MVQYVNRKQIIKRDRKDSKSNTNVKKGTIEHM